MKHFVRIFATISLSLLPLMGAGQEASQSNSRPESDTYHEVIEGLRSDSFMQRRSAFFDLWSAGQSAIPAIEQAKESDDLQISTAAKVLQKVIELQVSPSEVGPNVFESLLNPNIDQITSLCRRGNWDLAVHLFETNEKLAGVFRSPQANPWINMIVEAALEQGDAMLAWPLIRLIGSSQGPPADKDLSLFLAARQNWPTLEQQNATPDELALSDLYAANARRGVERAQSDAVSRMLLARGGQWQKLADESSQQQIAGITGKSASLVVRSVLLELAEQDDEAGEVWKQLEQNMRVRNEDGDQSGEESDSSATAIQLALRSASPFEINQLILALTIRGDGRAIADYLREANPNAAFSYFVAIGDYSSALQLVELDRDLSNFDDWLADREAEISQELSRAIRGTDMFDQTAHVCSMLTGIGFHDQAKELIEMLADKADVKPELWYGRGSIISWMGRGEQRALCLASVAEHAGRLSRDNRESIIAALFPEIAAVGSALERTAPPVFLPDGRRESFIILLDKLHNWDTEFFDEQLGPAAISDWLTRAERRLIVGQVAAKEPGTLVDQLSELAKLAFGCGLPELGLAFSQTDVRTLGATEGVWQEQWLIAADHLLKDHQAEAAAELLERYRKQSFLPSDHAALIKEARARVLSGDHDLAVSLDKSRWLRLLSVRRYFGGNYYSQVADQLIDESDFELAREYGELAFLLSDYGSVDSYWASSTFSEILEELEEFDTSANVLRARLLEALQPGAPMLSFFVRNDWHHFLLYAAVKERLHRAIALIEDEEYELARKHIMIGRRLQPQDIEFVVQCFPRLQSAGQTELAAELFELFESEMLQQIDEWPRDATALNNLAWMYSQCDAKLSEALSLATQAVELAPSSAVYLDTLAEVYFRLGRSDEALRAAYGCIRLDPRDTHYRSNIKRFQDALAETAQ